MKIIFLDIDGVLNCETAYKNGYCKYTEMIVDSEDEKNHYQQFYPPSKKLLNILIEQTDAKIVISSTWRLSGLNFMRNVWNQEGMSGEVIDITPNFWSIKNEEYEHEGVVKPVNYRIPRGIEIDMWLQWKGFGHIFWSKELQQEEMDKSGIENYIIIDDDSDMLHKQKNHFIHVKGSPRNMDGFKEEHFEQAYSILNKNLLDLYYD